RASRRRGPTSSIGVDHHPDELAEANARLPAELLLRLRVVALEDVHLRGAEEAGVGLHVLAPVEFRVAERLVEELLDRVRLTGREHVVVGLLLLEHPPRALHVVARVAPVAARIEVAEAELALLTPQDRAETDGDLARDEALGAARRLVVEEDPVDGVHPVGLAVVARDPVAEHLADRVGAPGMERGLLALRHLDDLAEHLTRRRLVEAAVEVALANRVEEAERSQRDDVRRVLGDVEADTNVALRTEVVDLVGPDRAHQLVQRRAVAEIA